MKKRLSNAQTLLCVLALAVGLLVIPGVSSPTDAVDIKKAEFHTSTSTLNVEASSTRQGAVLEVYTTSTDELIGTLDPGEGGLLENDFELDENPQRVTVKSNYGGSAVADVEVKP